MGEQSKKKQRKYVLCIFSDGDMRVYFSGCSPRSKHPLNVNDAFITKRMYSYDKKYLLTLAKMGRSDSWNEQDRKIDLSEQWEENQKRNKLKKGTNKC